MALRLRAPACTRGAARSVVVRAAPTAAPVQQAKAKVLTAAEAIKQAEDVCTEGSQKECAAAWDQVERIAAEEEFQARKRLAMMRRASELSCASKAALNNLLKNDPLEQFCEGNPDADECRVYED